MVVHRIHTYNRYPQLANDVTFTDAINNAIGAPAMITVFAALLLESTLENKQYNKYLVIASALFLTNVLTYYFQQNGF
jgi:hypothetical protein